MFDNRGDYFKIIEQMSYFIEFGLEKLPVASCRY